MNKKIICFIAVFLLCFSMADAAILTKIENEISKFSGISYLDNSDGISVNVTIHNSSGGVVVSRNAAVGIYKENMTIVMAGAKFNLSYGTGYIYNLSTIYGDFTYNFTTPSYPALSSLHTGQTTCWNAAGGVISCTDTGQDADLDGKSKSYTNSSCGTGTVGDDYTGLCWQWDYVSGKTWVNALTYCNVLDLGGHTDWRLPNAVELRTMLDYSRSDYKNPAFSWSGSYYWSSTTRPDSTGFAYFADVDYGYIIYFGGKSSTYYVRCVRSD